VSCVIIVDACFKSLSGLCTRADLRFVIEGNKAQRSSTRRENRGGMERGSLITGGEVWRKDEPLPRKNNKKIKFKIATFLH